MGEVVRGISEIVLWAHDLERTLSFYRDLLGLEVISPPELPNRFLKAAEGAEGVPQMIVLVPHPGGPSPQETPRRVPPPPPLTAPPRRYEELRRRLQAERHE